MTTRANNVTVSEPWIEHGCWILTVQKSGQRGKRARLEINCAGTVIDGIVAPNNLAKILAIGLDPNDVMPLLIKEIKKHSNKDIGNIKNFSMPRTKKNGSKTTHLVIATPSYMFTDGCKPSVYECDSLAAARIKLSKIADRDGLEKCEIHIYKLKG